MKKITFIVNPVSGVKSKAKLLDRIRELMPLKDCEWRMVTTESPGHATELAAQAASSGSDVVVAIGGDGTVNEVARGLVGSSAALGIIPFGSGNGLARDLGVPMKPEEALSYILDNVNLSNRIDCCIINGEKYFCTAGVGYDARVSADYARRNKEGHRGLITYVRAAVRKWFENKTRRITMSIDDTTNVEVDSLLVTFANASQYGNDAFIAPRASMRDGLIDVVVVKPISLWSVPRLVVQLFRRCVDKNKHVEVYRAKKVILTTATDEPFHYDGENGQPSSRFEVEICPAALNVVGE
ncbi:MAG: diacylglycerol kinase family lipid kinase [Muribaculaceae bacterium]|nr:diacylglycerol kinase family lipid kinase [Muribaculaceae bacterium]